MSDWQQPNRISTPSDATKQLSRCIGMSMTPDAILDRLKAMSELSGFCSVLGKALYIGKVSELGESQPDPPH